MNATYLALEVKRVVRGARFMIFTVAFPVVIYLIDANLFGSGGDTYPDGLAIAPSLMVRMAAFGAMSAALFTGARVALERSSGWQRQLRLTPMSGASYLLSKAAVSMLVALPTIVLVSLAGVLVEHVRLSAGQWVQILLGVWLGTIPIVLLGLLIGLVTTKDSMQPVTSVVMLVLGMIGGLWIPSNIVPAGFQSVMWIFPTYWLGQIGDAALEHSSAIGTAVLVLAVWSAVLALIGARRYRASLARA
ncbi:MAG: ABC transporter permease [Pseudonocardiaceae bacterium]